MKLSLPTQGFIIMTILVVAWHLLMSQVRMPLVGWAITASILYLLYSLGGRDNE